jgi:hypothetical protein
MAIIAEFRATRPGRVLGIGKSGLKTPRLTAYDPCRRARQSMCRRLAIVFSVVAMGLVLNGCTKCGPIWEDWMQSPKSCKSDHF